MPVYNPHLFAQNLVSKYGVSGLSTGPSVTRVVNNLINIHKYLKMALNKHLTDQKGVVADDCLFVKRWPKPFARIAESSFPRAVSNDKLSPHMNNFTSKMKGPLYEIFEPDRDIIQPDSGGNTVLGVKNQPDMNLTKKCLALCWRARQVSCLCPAEVWPDRTPTQARQETKISCMD